ncbi:beta-ketoacyl-ACP synthase [Atopomonas sediminilitoris]|uniref:beta-ketoacyl-ACP synthase n=1 Tax=Atopomonas sediminilitoris TaxID=2919919 RepID=UPI001F4D3A6D|nr:beta-ketoacyl-ACP synthase [Atopomonas sediminilitoris]MCJ8170378.1 beta-ketoacyl-ACP synthase [Atopomonas sediminilitoris]
MTSYLNALGLVCPLGDTLEGVSRALFNGDSGLQPQSHWIADKTVPVGAVTVALAPLPASVSAFDNRCNRLLHHALQPILPAIKQALSRYGATRVGLVLGTSTAGILEGGLAIREGQSAAQAYLAQELSSCSRWLEQWLGLQGPVTVISTACTSGARALLSAQRLLQSGLCDAVICGGVDSLCHLTLNGFDALEAISQVPCLPLSQQRNGINIGEAAAVFLMTREPGPIALLGAAASSDAHHMSAPDPSGAGAVAAMRGALASAQLTPAQIHYINLHGTATPHNDAMESLAVAEVFGGRVPCSSTKPLTGHTLGAAGALEAAFCWLSLSSYNPERRLPPHRWDGNADPALPTLTLVDHDTRLAPALAPRLLSNSFAFGGNNACLILGATDA